PSVPNFGDNWFFGFGLWRRRFFSFGLCRRQVLQFWTLETMGSSVPGLSVSIRLSAIRIVDA
ncbi:hypothetical protein RhiirA1_485594, partial [Rhizophagus irregularis]